MHTTIRVAKAAAWMLRPVFDRRLGRAGDRRGERCDGSGSDVSWPNTLPGERGPGRAGTGCGATGAGRCRPRPARRAVPT